MHSDSVQRKTLLLGIWTMLAFVYLFPYTWMVLTGFRQPIDTLTMPPRFFFAPTLDGFLYLFETSQFQFYLLNSFIVALSSSALTAEIWQTTKTAMMIA